MTNLIASFKTAVSNVALFTAAVVMVGLGFAFVGTIALFGLVAVGVAVIASAFTSPNTPAPADDEIIA